MPHPDFPHIAAAAGLTAILVWAAVSDIIARRIPNAAVLLVMALYGVWAVIGSGAGLGSALAAGGIGLVAGFGLYAFNIMGAGDVKLFAATALFTGLSYLPLFALATALSGGLIVVGSIIARPQRAAVMLTLKGKGDFGRGVPYGVAIAMGGAAVIWGALLGGVSPNALAVLG